MPRTVDTPPAAGRSSAALPWLAGLLLVGVTAGGAALLSSVAPGLPRLLPDYQSAQDGAYTQIGAFLRWWIGDTTEAEFFKTGLGGVGMLAGAWVAHVAWSRGRRWAGFPISAGSGLWPWLVTAALLGLLLSELAWGWTIPATGKWQPTFVPFVSVPPAVVLVYGRGWAVAGTGAVLGAALTTPVALLVVNFFCYPLGLPTVIGNVTGMWAGALIAFLICRHLPWMRRPPADAAAPTTAPRQGPGWVVRRSLADFTEAQFYGNELASIGLIAGTVVAYLLNPLGPAYGSGLLPAMLTAQVLTATVGVLVYRRRWAVGWYPTFVPVVSVAPAAVLTFGATPQAVVVGAVLGALAGPPVAAWISRRLPADFHPFIGNVMSMTVCTLAFIPTLALLPWFTPVS